MGNGNIDVGKQTSPCKPGQLAENFSGRKGSSALRIDSSLQTERHCGVMSQQGAEFPDNVSAPQKFVRLVGCREPKR